VERSGKRAGVALARAAELDGDGLVVREGLVGPDRVRGRRLLARQDDRAQARQVAAEVAVGGNLRLVDLGHHVALAHARSDALVGDAHGSFDDRGGLAQVIKFRLALHGARPVHHQLAVDEGCVG
jgi:hypothetical protein